MEFAPQDIMDIAISVILINALKQRSWSSLMIPQIYVLLNVQMEHTLKFHPKNVLVFALYKTHNSQIQPTKFALALAQEHMQISQQEPVFQHVQQSLPFSPKATYVFSTAPEDSSLTTQLESVNTTALIALTLIIALGHALACVQQNH